MENLDNYKIANLTLNLNRKGDLLYHEGPLLSHFVAADSTREHYFYKWSDCDERCNRWLIFKVSVENLLIFFEGKLNLLDLIQKNQFVYFADFDGDINEINAFICPTQKIPEDYLPSERSFFKEKQYEKYALELKKTLQKEENQAKENQLLEILVKKMLSIEKQQICQNLLLRLIFDNLNKKISPNNIFSPNSFNLPNLENKPPFSNYEKIKN